MSLNPTSSHGGGLALSGGTLTGPLVVHDTNNNDIPVEVDFSLAGINVNVFSLHSTDGGGRDIVYVDSGGSFHVNDSAGNGIALNAPNQILISDATGAVFTADRSSGLFTVGKLRTSPPAPATVALVSGTGAQLSTTADVHSVTPVTFNPGAATTATCLVQVSPDGVTYTTLGTETEPVGVALDGTIHLIHADLPYGWYLKLTVTNATLGTTTYY